MKGEEGGSGKIIVGNDDVRNKFHVPEVLSLALYVLWTTTHTGKQTTIKW